MQDKYFYAPVSLNIGEGVDCKITSLADMAQFLQTWPSHRRSKLFQIAVKACETAQAGYITMDQARRTLVTFAEAVGILRKDLEPEIAGRATASAFSGFAA